MAAWTGAIPLRAMLLLAAAGPLCTLLATAAVITEAYAVRVPRISTTGIGAAQRGLLPAMPLAPIRPTAQRTAPPANPSAALTSLWSPAAQQGSDQLAATAALLAAATASLVAYLVARWRRTSLGMMTDVEPFLPAASVWAMTGASGNPDSASERVDRVLSKIRDSDAGANLAKEDRAAVDQLLESLEKDFALVQPRPLGDPSIFDNYRVSYVSVGRDQIGNPAGGRWRGAIGKAIFRTTGLYQNLLRDNVVINVVAFRFLSCLKGCVVLKGTFAPTEQSDFVRATFQSPRLCFSFGGLKMAFEIGPPSAVELDCAYLDDRVRLGKGSRGSRFVFERTKDAQANVWQDVMALQPIPALVVPLAVAAALGLLFCLLRSNVVVGVAGLLVIGLYLLVARNGGIIDADTAIAPEA